MSVSPSDTRAHAAAAAAGEEQGVELPPVKHQGEEDNVAGVGVGAEADGASNAAAAAAAPTTLSAAGVQSQSSTSTSTTTAPRPSLSKQVTPRTLSASSDGLVLFDLTHRPGGALSFSSHCIKTIIDLKLLRVGYERVRMSFAQIRSELEARITQGVTVPSVELADGSHLTDSWAIALYLESKHPQGHLLFPTTAAKHLAAHLNTLGRTHLAPHISSLAIPRIAPLLDAESHAYFVHTKVGSARFARLSAALDDEGEVQAHVQGARKVLEGVEAMLGAGQARADVDVDVDGQQQQQQQAKSSSSSSSKWLAGTEMPSHADACLFGWYVYTLAAGPSLARDIWLAQDVHPRVAAWVAAMRDWCGEEVCRDFVGAGQA